ncbi:hypothetical protein SEA_ZELINK_151 [Mycobacterium phage Zelink]|nr:hypothetical protein SEA_ZELINK_151 [Mycobacterium phage Zelink]
MITLLWIYLSFGIISALLIGGGYFLEHRDITGIWESILIAGLMIVAWPFLLVGVVRDLLR